MATTAIVKVSPKVIPTGAYARSLYTPPRSTISTITSETPWPNPLQPVTPVGSPGRGPFGWQFLQGQNLIFTPRADRMYSPQDLRYFATYPLARFLIDARKDQMAAKKWRIGLTPEEGESVKKRHKRETTDAVAEELTTLFENPNPDVSYRGFVAMLMEEVLVGDGQQFCCGAIVPRRLFRCA